MTLFTGSGSLPRHLYVKVDGAFLGLDTSQDAVWFGLHAHPGRAWGCTVMLESGAVYRNLPPHALVFGHAMVPWTLRQAQLWDCYGDQFSLHAYDYLDGLSAVARIDGQDVPCAYLFTAIPIGDPYTDEPEQGKEFMFLRTAGGRLTIQPTNRVLFRDKSFTRDTGWPRLRLSSAVWSCEREF